MEGGSGRKDRVRGRERGGRDAGVSQDLPSKECPTEAMECAVGSGITQEAFPVGLGSNREL